MKEIYLDHASTTPPSKEVIQAMLQVLEEDYGNPSSLHRKGMKAEGHIKKTSELIAYHLKVSPSEIYYTSGGTESNNLAILGVAAGYKRSGRHLITTQMEHPSVGAPFRKLENQGYEVTYLPVNEEGHINIETLEKAIRLDTILVSIMHVNNEVGTIAPLEEIGRRIKAANPQTLFHVDGVQSFGKLPVYPKRWQIDFLSMSGHKIHGPKGIGVLYAIKNHKLHPLQYGGDQQKGLRSGTENTPGIAGLCVAVERAYASLEENTIYMYQLKKQLVHHLTTEIENSYVHGPSMEESSPHIINMRFEGVRGEVLLHALEDRNIYISTGSACSSHKSNKSMTLRALGLSDEQIISSVRISLSPDTKEEDIQTCIKEMKNTVSMLRKFTDGGKKK